MSKNIFASESHKKSRTLSGDMKLNTIPELKYPHYRVKSGVSYRTRIQKSRLKSIMIPKEQLYDENLQLKLLSNNLLEENIKLKTRLQQSENYLKKNNDKVSEKDFKGSAIVINLKEKVKEQKERIEKMMFEYNELKISLRATRVAELEEEAKQYFNECWRLKKLLEDSSKALNSQNKGSKEYKSEDYSQNINEKSTQQDATIKRLLTENKEQKLNLDSQLSENKSLKEQIISLRSDLKNFQKKKKNSVKEPEKKNSKETIKEHPKIPSKETPNKQLKELSKEQRKDISKEEQKAAPKESPQKIREESPKEPSKISPNTSLNDSPSNDPPPIITINKAFNKEITLSEFQDPSRELKRDLGSNKEILLDTFLRKISMQISSNSLNTADFITLMDPEGKETISVKQFYRNLVKNGYKFSKNEVEAVYDILLDQLGIPLLTTSALFDKLQIEDLDSNQSYDFSEESVKSSAALPKVPKPTRVNEVTFEQVSNTFEFLYVLVKNQRYTLGKLRDFVNGKLKDPVKLEALSSLFLEKMLRIEDGVERNKVCSFLMGEYEEAEKEAIVNSLMHMIFQEEPEEKVLSGKLQEILGQIQEKYEEFVKVCEVKDKNEKQFLSWKFIEEAVRDIGIEVDPVGLRQLQVKCYGIERSLNIIPYKEIVARGS